MPAALIATLGYSIGSLGAWHAALLWGASMLVALAIGLLLGSLVLSAYRRVVQDRGRLRLREPL